jgi:putative methionine-R-sulfoxide reductase with GAF domain
MSIEERIQQSVDSALAAMRARVEEDVRAIVQQVVTAASTERGEAVVAARQTALDEAAADTERKIAETETRVRATVDQLIEAARVEERDHANGARQEIEAATAEKIQTALDASREELRQAVVTAETRAAEQLHEALTSARVREREAELASVSRLLESIRGLDGASSLSEVLDALAQAAGREASRAGVLVLRADRLLGWRVSGFGPRDAQPKQIDLGVGEAGVVGLAVTTARAVTTRDAQTGADAPAFAPLPADRMGLAVPVIVGGRVVAVVYADSVTQDGRDQVVPSSWPEVIEILTRHAARCLEALTVQKAATQAPSPRFWVPPTATKTAAQPGGDLKTAADSGTSSQLGSTSEASMSRSGDADLAAAPEESARRFARLLLSEIKLYHEPAVDEGRRSRNLLSRLGPEIERARRIYDERVPASVRTRAELFHQELVATLAGGDAGLLGVQA